MDLEFGDKTREPDIRRLFDMKDVIFDQSWLAGRENFELYYMFRDLFLSRADGEKLRDQNLRYDITIIPPGMMGCEYIKTAGHYHPQAPGSAVTYPELYEVLEGEALYLLQNEDLSDVVAINAVAGDKVLVPPNYGHITINRSNKILKMSNFVARDFSSLYDPIKEKGGGAGDSSLAIPERAMPAKPAERIKLKTGILFMARSFCPRIWCRSCRRPSGRPGCRRGKSRSSWPQKSPGACSLETKGSLASCGS